MTTPNEIIMATAISSLTTGAGAVNQRRPQELTSPSNLSITAHVDCVVDPAAKNWVKFRGLVDQWRQERGASSSITDSSMLLPYQGIIGMGEDAIPLIIGELKLEGGDPDQWFWALMAITGQNPANPEDRGDFAKMAKAWLDWAADQGYAG